MYSIVILTSEQAVVTLLPQNQTSNELHEGSLFVRFHSQHCYKLTLSHLPIPFSAQMKTLIWVEAQGNVSPHLFLSVHPEWILVEIQQVD